MPCVFFCHNFLVAIAHDRAAKNERENQILSRPIYFQLRMKTSQSWEIILLHGFARCVIPKSIENIYLLRC